jgi:hypothetical protein
LKRYLAICLLLASWFVLCGMGLFPEGPTQVPKTKENFSATVYDTGGVSTKLSRFSIDADTFLPAKRGQGSLAIPFADIEEMSFQEGRVVVRLKGGQSAELTVDTRLNANGLSDYGPYRISLKGLSRVVIHGKL